MFMPPIACTISLPSYLLDGDLAQVIRTSVTLYSSPWCPFTVMVLLTAWHRVPIHAARSSKHQYCRRGRPTALCDGTLPRVSNFHRFSYIPIALHCIAGHNSTNETLRHIIQSIISACFAKQIYLSAPIDSMISLTFW